MSAASRQPARARRGRVLLVGQPGDFAQLDLATGANPASAPIFVRNMFDALGQVSASAPSTPIAAVIVSDHLLQPSDAGAIESLRKLDPALRLILARQNGSPPARAGMEWIVSGFDETIHAPLSAEVLARFIDDDQPAQVSAHLATVESAAPPSMPPVQGSPSNSAVHQQHAEPPVGVRLEDLRQKLAGALSPPGATPAQPPQSTHGPHAMRAPIIEIVEEIAAPSTTNATPAADTAGGAGHVMQPPRPSPSSAQAVSPQTNAPLGDTDLVDAILAASPDALAIALQLIAQQTGWRDLEFAIEAPPTPQPGDHNKASVEVIGSQRFGTLSSRTARAAQLKPWAEWLARWLTLDHAHRDFQLKAHQDDLTGAWNRRYFEAFLTQAIEQAGKVRRPVTVMVFDLDNFKAYNDEFGHDAGDEILRETVKLLNSVIRQGDRVCRIGGDEFAVIFADPEVRTPGSMHPESVDAIARRFQDQICKMRFPKLGEQAKGMISISAGLATYPWDGHDPHTLLRRADQLSLESKKRGKNAITFGPGTHRVCGGKT